jgi:hypothetical protein
MLMEINIQETTIYNIPQLHFILLMLMEINIQETTIYNIPSCVKKY